MVGRPGTRGNAGGEQDASQPPEGREQFAYVFDLGDEWSHLCTVGEKRIDPVAELGGIPDQPIPYWGWGENPDQYGRRWDGDDGESTEPKPPARDLSDLPPILPWWGPRQRG